MSKSEVLFQFYLQGLSDGWFAEGSNTLPTMPVEKQDSMDKIEKALGRKANTGRKENPEFQAALKVFNSPLIKALA